MREGRPSRTAIQIAHAVLYVDGDARRAGLLPTGSAALTRELLTAAGAWRPWYDRLAGSRLYHGIADGWAEALTPGHLTYIALRKRFFDAEARAALAAGMRQIAVLGAGFDTLALRLARERPELVVIEVDHPASHAAKSAAVDAVGGAPSNLRLVAADLAVTPLAEALGGAGWDRTQPGVVAVEGVLEYLEPSAVETVFRSVRETTAPGSRLLFTWMEADEHGRVILGRITRLLRILLRLAGESLQWWATETDLAELIARCGLRYDPDSARYDLGRLFLEPEGLGDLRVGTLERVGVAEHDP